jgi:hypothetical protein
MQWGSKVPSIAKRSSLAGAQVNTHTHMQQASLKGVETRHGAKEQMYLSSYQAL